VEFAEPIGRRTTLFLIMVAVSILAALAAYRVGKQLVRRRLDRFYALLFSAAVYTLLMLVAGALLPDLRVVGSGVPAELLWAFRIASLATQATLWTALGVGFGAVVERRILRYRAGALASDGSLCLLPPEA